MSNERWISSDGAIDLLCGDWREVLADVEACDAVICDPPYSARTHAGYRSAVGAGEGAIAHGTGITRYPHLRRSDVREVMAWCSRVRKWLAFFGDDITSQWWKRSMALRGWYTFRPLPVLNTNAPPRFTGDGPACDCEEVAIGSPDHDEFDRVVVARRVGIRDGARVGHYERGRVEGSRNGTAVVVGQKPLPLMRAIVRDYTKPGDLVVDPFCGGGTTALACAMEGRRCITSEVDPETYAKAKARLQRGHTRDMFASAPPPEPREQPTPKTEGEQAP